MCLHTVTPHELPIHRSAGRHETGGAACHERGLRACLRACSSGSNSGCILNARISPQARPRTPANFISKVVVLGGSNSMRMTAGTSSPGSHKRHAHPQRLVELSSPQSKKKCISRSRWMNGHCRQVHTKISARGQHVQLLTCHLIETEPQAHLMSKRRFSQASDTYATHTTNALAPACPAVTPDARAPPNMITCESTHFVFFIPPRLIFSNLPRSNLHSLLSQTTLCSPPSTSPPR